MFEGGMFQLARCDGCGTLRTEGTPAPSELAAYYRYGDAAAPDARFVPLLEPLMRTLRRARVGAAGAAVTPGRVLDVGCGRGILLERLRERGWEVWGTEMNAELAGSARTRLGDRILAGDLQDLAELDARGPFELVTFWHVLEHLRDPAGALVRAAELLTPRGRVVVALPNLSSWQARFAGRHWLHIDVPRHRWHFPIAALPRLAARAGLEIVSVRGFSLEYGPYGWLQSALARAGLGHVLFTDIVRRGGRGRRVAGARLWAHVVLVPLIAVAAVVSLPLELAAAAAGAGGAPVVTMRRTREAGVRA